MAHREEELSCLKSIVEAGKRLHQKDFIAAADGNISYRFSDKRILITPSGRHKGYLERSDIAILNLEGETIAGNPSSESKLHLEVYKQVPEAKAVIHAHAPICTAWTIADPEMTKLPDESMAELILAVGEVPVVPYRRPGTSEMASAVGPYVKDHHVVIMARHGVLSWGADLDEAYMAIERVEHAAKILWSARQMGGLTDLPESEIHALRKIREQMGNKVL